MVGWQYQLSGQESEQTLGDDEGQGSLAFPSPWGRRVRHNLVTEQQHPLGNVTPSSCETGPLCLSILSWGAASRWKKMLACQGQRPGPSTQTFKHGKSLSHV